MAYEKAPAFQFYPKDWLSDARVQALSHAQRGVYIDLLSYCWIEGSLPADPQRLARLCRSTLSRKRWTNLVHPIQQLFDQHGDRLYHKRLEKERGKQNFFSELQQKRGRAGAKGRWSRGVASGHHPAKPKHGPAGLSLLEGERAAQGSPPLPPQPLQESPLPDVPDELRALPGESFASYFARMKSQGQPS